MEAEPQLRRRLLALGVLEVTLAIGLLTVEYDLLRKGVLREAELETAETSGQMKLEWKYSCSF